MNSITVIVSYSVAWLAGTQARRATNDVPGQIAPFIVIIHTYLLTRVALCVEWACLALT